MKEQSTDQGYKDVRVFKSHSLLSYLNQLIQIQALPLSPPPGNSLQVAGESWLSLQVLESAFFNDFLPSSLKGIFK